MVPIDVPPLRQRTEDIPALVDIFLEEAAASNRDKRKGFSENALEILRKYTWPGNVRELKNLVERMAIMVQADTITAAELPAHFSESKSVEGSLFAIDALDEARKAFLLSPSGI